VERSVKEHVSRTSLHFLALVFSTILGVFLVAGCGVGYIYWKSNTEKKDILMADMAVRKAEREMLELCINHRERKAAAAAGSSVDMADHTSSTASSVLAVLAASTASSDSDSDDNSKPASVTPVTETAADVPLTAVIMSGTR
jgi:hypothetical protein